MEVFAGSLKTIDTEALDSAQVEVLYADQRTIQILRGSARQWCLLGQQALAMGNG